MQLPLSSQDEITVLDVYRLESQEISIDLSDGTSVTLTVSEILTLRNARPQGSEAVDQ